MKLIIMQQTVPFICKSQEDVNKLLQGGFEVKNFKFGNYLIKEI